MTDFSLLLTAICLYLTFPEFEYVCALNYRWPALFRAIFIVLMRASPYMSRIMTGVQLCKIKSLRPAFWRGTSLLIDNPLLLIRKSIGGNGGLSLQHEILHIRISRTLHRHTHMHAHTHAWGGMKWNTYWMGRLLWSEAECGEKKRKRTMNENEMMNSWWWHMMDETFEGDRQKNGPLLSSIQNEQAHKLTEYEWSEVKLFKMECSQMRGPVDRLEEEWETACGYTNEDKSVLIDLWFRWFVCLCVCTRMQVCVCVANILLSVILQLLETTQNQSLFALHLLLGMTFSFCCKILFADWILSLVVVRVFFFLAPTNTLCLFASGMCVVIHCEHTCVDICQQSW